MGGLFVVLIHIASDILPETTFLFLFVILIPILIIIITFIKTGHKLQKENANMNFSLYGIIIYLYRKTILLNRNFINFTNKIKKIQMLLLILFGLLISLVPQFSTLEVVSKTSTSLPLMTIEVIVFTVLVLGLFYFLLLIIYFAFYELIVEILFQRKVNKIVKDRKRMSLDELTKAAGVLEDDLSLLLKKWITKPGKDTGKIYKAADIIKSGNLQFDIK